MTAPEPVFTRSRFWYVPGFRARRPPPVPLSRTCSCLDLTSGTSTCRESYRNSARRLVGHLQRSAHLAFLLLRPGVFRAQRQLVVDVHLVPADLVEPDHAALGFEIFQLLPQPRLLCVDWQRCDPG